MIRRQQSVARLQARCDAFNQNNPIGSAVKFYPVIGGPAFRLRTTASQAWVLSGHTAVVQLDGESGCVALEACQIHEAK